MDFELSAKAEITANQLPCGIEDIAWSTGITELWAAWYAQALRIVQIKILDATMRTNDPYEGMRSVTWCDHHGTYMVTFTAYEQDRVHCTVAEISAYCASPQVVQSWEFIIPIT